MGILKTIAPLSAAGLLALTALAGVAHAGGGPSAAPASGAGQQSAGNTAGDGGQKKPYTPPPLTGGYVFSPRGCDFSITLPQEPYSAQRCPGSGEQCYRVNSYTKVFGMQATVNFRLTCNPSDPGMFERYDGPSLQAALRGMVDIDTVADYSTRYDSYEDAKVASLTGAGEAGRTPMIYMSQIWVGKRSVFTVEGELIGEAYKPSDDLFAQILGSIGRAPDSAGSEDSGEKQPLEDSQSSPGR